MPTIRKTKEGAQLSYDDRALFNCVIGKNGITNNKTEGDMCTPAGEYLITDVYYRPDRIEIFDCAFDLKPVQKNFGWCDEPDCADYNRLVLLPHGSRAEELWRDDELYDIVAVLDYNSNPVIRGKGSAIFLHVAKPDMSYTKGCIALSKPELIEVLKSLQKNTKIKIQL